MSHRRISKEELVCRIQQVEPLGTKPVFVAISGFGGSGKSTLANFVVEKLESVSIIPIDDFIIGERTHRSADWSTFDRLRLQNEILQRAVTGKTLRYQQFHSGEWVSGVGGAWRELSIGEIVVIEGCGVIHPNLMPFYDYSAWIDCPQDIALVSAKKRDANEAELFRDDDTTLLWDTVWGPNDSDYFEQFRPDLSATVLVEPQF